MKLAATRELHEYWNKLRGGRSAPERSEIDPAAIRSVLADTFILEVNSSAGYPFRVAGARTSSMFQRELRGRPFLDLWDGASTRTEIDEILAYVCDEATPLVAGATTKPQGFQPIELEVLLLPLRHRGETHARILGLCTPAAAPQWLGLAAVAPLTLLSTRVLRRAEDDGEGFSARKKEEQPSVPSAPRSLSRFARRGHFYLVTGAHRQP
ncbi:MAG TPA: PAS domain-containing protein [Roseiarcus sp.]|nr:PAS domain-containing protein [Roseiarcus sp.]